MGQEVSRMLWIPLNSYAILPASRLSSCQHRLWCIDTKSLHITTQSTPRGASPARISSGIVKDHRSSTCSVLFLQALHAHCRIKLNEGIAATRRSSWKTSWTSNFGNRSPKIHPSLLRNLECASSMPMMRMIIKPSVLKRGSTYSNATLGRYLEVRASMALEIIHTRDTLVEHLCTMMFAEFVVNTKCTEALANTIEDVSLYNLKGFSSKLCASIAILDWGIEQPMHLGCLKSKNTQRLLGNIAVHTLDWQDWTYNVVSWVLHHSPTPGPTRKWHLLECFQSLDQGSAAGGGPSCLICVFVHL